MVDSATTTDTPSPHIRQLSTVNQLTEKYRFVTPGAIRCHIFNADSNGLEESGALVRIGRRVFIDEEKFFDWIDSLQGKPIPKLKNKPPKIEKKAIHEICKAKRGEPKQEKKKPKSNSMMEGGKK
jgi:hypothetical protein